jgi:hypothetical protein
MNARFGMTVPFVMPARHAPNEVTALNVRVAPTASFVMIGPFVPSAASAETGLSAPATTGMIVPHVRRAMIAPRAMIAVLSFAASVPALIT